MFLLWQADGRRLKTKGNIRPPTAEILQGVPDVLAEKVHTKKEKIKLLATVIQSNVVKGVLLVFLL